MPLRDDRDTAVAELNKLYKRLKKQVDYLRAAPVYPTSSEVSGGEDGSGAVVEEGVTDHGALTGLLDDDHPQYFSNHIILIPSDPSRIQKFDKTERGLQQALDGAESGDVVWLPAGTISEDHTVPAGVALVGESRDGCILSGQITLNDESVLENLSIIRTSADDDIICVVGPASGSRGYVYNCNLEATTTGFGSASAAKSLADDTLWLLYCRIRATDTNGARIPLLGGTRSASLDTIIHDFSSDSFTSGTYVTDELKIYELDVEGELDRDNTTPGYECDAQWRCYADWSDRERVNIFQLEAGIGLIAIDTDYDGTDHKYTFNRKGTGAVFQVTLGDTNYADNTGTVTIDVYEITEWTRVLACDMVVQCGYPLESDRSAWNIDYDKGLHSQDLDVEKYQYHTPLSKYDATSAPTANDDSDDGYAVGSRWFDVTNDKSYVCLDATVGAAIWQEGGGGDASEITYTPDDDTDWDGDTDPGNVDDALDQIAERVDDNETSVSILEAGRIHLLFSQISDKEVVNTTDEISLVGTGYGSSTLLANSLGAGDTIRLTLGGHLSDNGAPNLNIKVKLGGTEVCSTGAQALNNTVSDVDWHITVIITCRSVGATGTVVASGLFEHDDDAQFGLVNTSPTTIDTTGSLEIDITATWGTAHADNSIVCQEVSIEKLSVSGLTAPPSLLLLESSGALLLESGNYLLLEVNTTEYTITSRKTLWGSGVADPDDWLGRPVLIDNGSTWIVVYREADKHSADSDGQIHIRFSEDEGETWTAEDTFTDGGSVTGFPINDHSSAVADIAGCVAPNGDILIFVTENDGTSINGTYQYSSSDDGDTWSDDGKIDSDNELRFGGGQAIIIGSDIYLSGWQDISADRTPPYKSILYKSSDNGGTWSDVGDITSTAEETDEVGIESLGGNNLIAILRDSNLSVTYKRESSDLGSTWGTLTDISGSVGVVNRPTLIWDSDRLILIGRDYQHAYGHAVAMWYSDDDGSTWTKFSISRGTLEDAGYSSMLIRTDGDYYLLTYEGTNDEANIIEYLITKDK